MFIKLLGYIIIIISQVIIIKTSYNQKIKCIILDEWWNIYV